MLSLRFTTREGNPMDFSQALGQVSWLAVLAAVVAAFMLGYVWYGPLFGKAWQRMIGLTDEQMRNANMPMIFGTAFLLQAVAIIVLATFIGPDPTVGTGAFYGFLVGAAWVATAHGVTYLFDRKPFALWAIDSGYHVAYYTLAGAILGALS